MEYLLKPTGIATQVWRLVWGETGQNKDVGRGCNEWGKFGRKGFEINQDRKMKVEEPEESGEC